MIAEVITGEKRISIRTDHRDYEVGGHMLIGCHKANWAILATCTEVRHTRMNEITSREAHDDGFDTVEDLFRKLREFYPNLEWDSNMTVVRWSYPEGAMCH
jgi:hypothetical protein